MTDPVSETPLDPAEKAFAAAAEAAVTLPPLKPAKTVKTKSISKPKPARKPNKPASTKIKEPIMAKNTTDYTAAFTGAFADFQAKAKEAYEKGTAGFGEASEFAKGNVEALVESGKIFAEGAKALGTDLVAEGKSAVETLTADVKEMAAIKAPADFFKFQSELARRNFDAMVATASKNSEAMLKLANDAFAPLSTRVSLAVEKLGKAA